MPLAATPPTPRRPTHPVIVRAPKFWPQRRHIRPLSIERRTGPRELTRHTAARPTASSVGRRPAEPPEEDRGSKGHHHDLGHRHHVRRLLSPRGVPTLRRGARVGIRSSPRLSTGAEELTARDLGATGYDTVKGWGYSMPPPPRHRDQRPGTDRWPEVVLAGRRRGLAPSRIEGDGARSSSPVPEA
jgi:hypothetical protein